MIALARYMMLKGMREKVLTYVLFGPLLLIGTPMLALMVRALIRHETVYPFTLAGSSPEKSAMAFFYSAAMMATFAGAAAAFWIFRSEIANHSIASLFLATRPIKLCINTIAYGTAAGTASFLLCIPLLALLSGSLPPHWLQTVAATVATTALGSTLALAFASLSTDLGILLPAGFIGLPLTITMLKSNHVAWSIAAAIIGIAPVIACIRLERRCAA